MNWSAVARDAIEARLQLEELKMNGKVSLVGRLKASRSESLSRRNADGERAGKMWLDETASFDELERLHRFMDDHGNHLDDFFTEDPSGSCESFEHFAAEISGEPHGEVDADDFWRRATGDDERWKSSGWVRGFITAAAEGYAEVRSEVLSSD